MQGEIVNEPKERIDPKTGKRWIQDHEATFDKAIRHYEKQSKSPNKHHIIRYLQDKRLGDPNKRSARKAITKSRCLRIFGVLQNIDVWCKYKPFTEITAEDVRKLVVDLKEDLIISQKTSRAYSETTKASMFKMLKMFWRWLKNTSYDPPEVDWICTYAPQPVGEVFALEDVEFVAQQCASFPMKTILWLFF